MAPTSGDIWGEGASAPTVHCADNCINGMSMRRVRCDTHGNPTPGAYFDGYFTGGYDEGGNPVGNYVYAPVVLSWSQLKQSANMNKYGYYGVTDYQIADYAFMGNLTLVDIVLPDTCTYIGDYAFYSAQYLESLSIPYETTYVGYATFAYTYSLMYIDYESTLQALSDYQHADYIYRRGWDAGFQVNMVSDFIWCMQDGGMMYNSWLGAG